MTLTVEDIRAAELERYQHVDEVLWPLLDARSRIWAGGLADELIAEAPELWRPRRWAVGWVRGWLIAAEERGELMSSVHRGAQPRRYYQRPLRAVEEGGEL